jgi:hypothetical protein
MAEVSKYSGIINELYAVHRCSVHYIVFDEPGNSNSLIAWSVFARP